MIRKVRLSFRLMEPSEADG
jgi:hypothetical protein